VTAKQAIAWFWEGVVLYGRRDVFFVYVFVCLCVFL
jgi:hypothetical protein